MASPEEAGVPRILHVVVGHGLPSYFLNTINSVRMTAPNDPVLVIDNASPQAALREALRTMADEDPRVDLILRSSNDLRSNRKVGGLYQAYELAFEYAMTRNFELVHLLQGDFQQLWWDDELVKKSVELYESHPNCVNILTQIMCRDKELTDDLSSAGDGLVKLSKYGLTDTGLYHLGRWRAGAMRFGANEQGHARHYLAAGYEVLCHPWPSDAPIPWPAVTRNGKQRGREVSTGKPFLLKPLSCSDVVSLKATAGGVWLEDVGIPWGWVCATPMWVSGLDSIDYWVMRYRDAKKNGILRILPRPELRGVADSDRRVLLRPGLYRPSPFGLFVTAPAREVTRRLRSR